jgi:acyl dehydratase
MRVIKLQELPELIGQELALSDWVNVPQSRIDQFAQATGDHQWIHVDPQRAGQGPFGTTIAHGFLTLSLLPVFVESSIQFSDARMGINYGLNRVRFTAPVPVDSRLRGRIRLLAAERLSDQGWQITIELTVEREGSERPVCIAESISRRYA